MNTKIVTCESVTSGHPDKLCDFISDSILDACLEKDENSKVACEVMATNKFVVIAGEITTNAVVDYKKIAKQAIEEVGYSTKEYEFLEKVQTQSLDIFNGVIKSYENREESSTDEYSMQGAGDQGIMYGYATNETKEFMPLPYVLSMKLTEKLTIVRKNNEIQGLLPDGKSQVSILYENDVPKYATSVIISTQHYENVNLNELREEILNKVIKPVLKNYVTDSTKVLINPSGRFVLGGVEADTGLTGRKIIVDTYGGVGRHGGGAFSGKDASKVDRSGAYMARYIAKNIVASGLCDKCEVAISYAIGKAEPTSVNIDTFFTGKVSDEIIKQIVLQVFDLRPKAIIECLNLKQPIYKKTSVNGHFGKNEFAWEKTDKVEEIKNMIKIKNLQFKE